MPLRFVKASPVCVRGMYAYVRCTYEPVKTVQQSSITRYEDMLQALHMSYRHTLVPVDASLLRFSIIKPYACMCGHACRHACVVLAAADLNLHV